MFALATRSAITLGAQRAMRHMKSRIKPSRPQGRNKPEKTKTKRMGQRMKKISRQRKWQLKQIKLGNCIKCGKPAAPSVWRYSKNLHGKYCEKHKKRPARQAAVSREGGE